LSGIGAAVRKEPVMENGITFVGLDAHRKKL
jgi:hypothetical protein